MSSETSGIGPGAVVTGTGGGACRAGTTAIGGGGGDTIIGACGPACIRGSCGGAGAGESFFFIVISDNRASTCGGNVPAFVHMSSTLRSFSCGWPMVARRRG